MPPLYYLSMGHVFRTGTTGIFKRSAFLKGGFFFIAIAGYAFLAPLFFLVPVYWFQLVENLRRQGASNGVQEHL